jgi:hypothetical protein
MSEKVALNESELENVQGGFMMFYGGNMVMVYTHSDGTKTRYPITNGDAVAANDRCLILHTQYHNQEDRILEILQKEGIVGQELSE